MLIWIQLLLYENGFNKMASLLNYPILFLLFLCLGRFSFPPNGFLLLVVAGNSSSSSADSIVVCSSSSLSSSYWASRLLLSALFLLWAFFLEVLLLTLGGNSSSFSTSEWSFACKSLGWSADSISAKKITAWLEFTAS